MNGMNGRRSTPFELVLNVKHLNHLLFWLFHRKKVDRCTAPILLSVDSKKLDTNTMEPDCIQQTRIALGMLSDATMVTQNTIFNLRAEVSELREQVAELREQVEVQGNPVLVVAEPEAPPRAQYVANWALVPNGTRVKYCRNGFEAFGKHLANGTIRGDDGWEHNALSVFARHEFAKLQSSGQLPPDASPSCNAWKAVRFCDHDGWKPFHYIRTPI